MLFRSNPLSVSTSHSAGLEWDDYILSVAASTGYYIISVGSAIFSNGMPIIHLEPGDAKNVDLYVTKDANYARIRSIAPVAARCNTQATVNISGEVLKSNSIIQLKKDNSVINSSNFYYIDDKNIQADFDIPSGSAGIWDVVVTNPGTSTGDTITTQFKGFSITD